MHLVRVSRTLRAFVVASLAYATAAQAGSAIVGTVVSAETNKPIADVVVSATSPDLQGEQVVVTDAQGQYRIAELPPGIYTLRFDKESFRPIIRAEFRVRPEHTVRVNVELPPDTDVQGEFGCRPPAVDVGSTTTGMLVEPDFIQRLALNRPTDKGGASRSFESLVTLVPGAQREAYGVSINGASPFENAYEVDGLSTSDPVSGINALPLSVEFLQETNIITGGDMFDYGRATGGIIRARTRTGNNEFHGSVFGNWVPGVLGGTPTPTSGPTWTISGQNMLTRQGDLGATLGGPILKDRLWFFAGVAPALTLVEHTRTLNALGSGPDGANVTPIPGSSRTLFADERALQAMGKLTYLFNQDHNVSLSFITTPTRSGGDGRLTVDRQTGGVQDFINAAPESVGHSVLDGNFSTAAVNYMGAFLEKRLLIDANVGWSRQSASSLPADGSSGGNGASGLPRVTYTTRRPVTYFEPLPDEGLACGSDFSEQLARCPIQFYEAGGIGLTSSSTVDRYQANARLTGLLHFAGNHIVKAGVNAEHLLYERAWTYSGGAYLVEGSASQESPLPAQESRYTRNALGGFVMDSWILTNWLTLIAGVRHDAQWLYSPEGSQTFALGRQLSPSLGLVVDPLANGRMKLFGHYEKHRGQMPLGLMDGVVDPNILALSSSELVAGIESEVLNDVRLSATYTHRDLDPASEDPSRGDIPKAERTYDAVTVALSHVFIQGWLAQASYTWSRLYGNYEGPFRLAAGWGEPALQSNIDLASQVMSQSGLLPSDRTHTVKVFGARRFDITRDLSASIGLSYQGRSGTPINYLGAHPTLGMGETFVLPRGSSGERTPWVHVIDSNIGMSYRLDRLKVVSLTLEVFNLFNFQEVTRVNEHYTYASVLPLETRVEPGKLTPDMVTTTRGGQLDDTQIDKEFKKPIQHQAPRQVRLGLRYTF